jgi:3-phosphoshikimate 1-carboxyvinyltransferase
VRVRVTPGPILSGDARVPGDKSIAHRWLILAATARGSSRLMGLPSSLDVRSTAACLAKLSGRGRRALEAWVMNVGGAAEGHGSTWNLGAAEPPELTLEVEGEGRSGLVEASSDLDCGNSGTAMRLLAGVLAAAPFTSTLIGDESLCSRPMERLAAPLREMGAVVRTTEGHAPLTIEGGHLHGVVSTLELPSAQVKSAILFAGLGAEGTTAVTEPAPTRDHTERAFAALGLPIEVEGSTITVRGGSEHGAFAATVPGDPSSAAFLVAAAALSRVELSIRDIGLNPSRLHYLQILSRMGVRTRITVEREELGEPVGELSVAPGADLVGTEVGPDELPLIIDEVPVLALLATHARGDTWFADAGELRVKESDRLAGIARGIVALGGHAGAEGDDLVVSGLGLRGGSADARGDHRLAMAFAVAGIRADTQCEVSGMESADVSFPGFLSVMRGLGAQVWASS